MKKKITIGILLMLLLLLLLPLNCSSVTKVNIKGQKLFFYTKNNNVIIVTDNNRIKWAKFGLASNNNATISNNRITDIKTILGQKVNISFDLNNDFKGKMVTPNGEYYFTITEKEKGLKQLTFLL